MQLKWRSQPNAQGVCTEVILDPYGKVHTRDVMPHKQTQQLLDRNTALRNGGRNHAAQGRLGHSIPITTWTAWRYEWQTKAKKAGWSWEEFRNRKLNSRDYDKFRVGVNQV